MQLKIASASFVGEIRVLDISSAMVLFVADDAAEHKLVVAGITYRCVLCCRRGWMDGRAKKVCNVPNGTQRR